MAQTGFTPIQIYSSSTAAAAPTAGNLTNSTLGSELAINITDGKLFYKDNANAIQVIGWKTVPTTAGGTGLTSYTAGDTLYYASGAALTKLAIGTNKTIMTSSGTAPQWSASLDTTQGGTGVTSYTAGDLLFYASGTALSKLGIGTANRVLTSSGSAPQWSTNLAMAGSVSAVGGFVSDDGVFGRWTITQDAGGNQLFSTTVGFGGWRTASVRANATGANMTWGSDGNTTVGVGNLIIGTSGKGIDFSATPGTGTSELLADYEEGTYDPTISFSTSGSVTLNAALKTLSYTKVGRVVTVTGYLLVSSVSSPTGYMILTLPFSSKSGDAFSYSGSLLVSGTVSVPGNGFGLVGLQNSGVAWVFLSNATTLGTAVGQQLQANSEFRINFSYVAA